MSSGAPRFITEKEIEERKARDAAEGRTEEPYDPRPLYDRLQAERARKQEEYESQRAFKNQIHRLDDDEVAFLVEKDLERCRNEESAEEEAQRLIKEAQAANRAAILKASNPSVAPVKPLSSRPSLPPSSSTLNQKALLSGIKRIQSSPTKGAEAKRMRVEHEDNSSNSNIASEKPKDSSNSNTVASDEPKAGVLPGMDVYGDSSDESSDDDSSSDVEDAALTVYTIAETRVKQKRREPCE